jgi:hypothetical protein
MSRRSTKKGDDAGHAAPRVPLKNSLEFKRLLKDLKKLPADRLEAFEQWIDDEIEKEESAHAEGTEEDDH